MRYSDAKLLLRAHSATFPQARVTALADRYEVTQTLRQDGEVSLKLVLAIQYERKRDHTRLLWDVVLYAPNLSTHPNNAEFRAAISDMPSRMQAEVLSLRSRLNGHVPAADDYPWTELSAHVPHSTEADAWTEPDFSEWLFSVLLFAHTASRDPLPITTARALLRWATRPRAGEEPSAREFRLRLSSGWRVESLSAKLHELRGAA
jgi:hypothetical protein